MKGNEIDKVTLESLSNCLASKVCEITEINISGCPIYEIVALANLIKASHKVVTIIADNCGLNLNENANFKYLLECSASSKLKTLSLKKN